MFNFLKINKGFTLIEALVAISILMVAISSPIMLAQKGLSSSILSRDQMIASFLAQDGIESVKNIRDITAINQETNNLSWAGTSTGNIKCDLSGRECLGVLGNNEYKKGDCDTEYMDYTAVCSDDVNPGKDWLYDLQACVCDPASDTGGCDLERDGAKYCILDSTSLFNTDPATNKLLGVNISNSGSPIIYVSTENSDDNVLFKSYIINGTTQTKFSRKINIIKTTNDNEVSINVLVSWDSPYGKQNIEVKSFMYNYEINYLFIK